MDAVRRIADAVLYEGYILWPYRRSAVKNQRRWTFGGVYPRAHSEAHPDDAWLMQTQCLVEGEGDVDVRVRFLHVVERFEERDGFEPWDEAVERERGPGPIEIPAGADDGRRWRALDGSIERSEEQLQPGLRRLTVRISNTSPLEPGADREDALRQTFCSTHTVLRSEHASFVSLTDPPPELPYQCDNVGTWPVLVEDRHTMLSSPIILPDYPQVAPESPGDMFDSAEIDQLLRLSILSLTEEEKEAMRASDPRAREILDLTEGLTEEQLMKLHGAIRDLR
ncbi:MAG: hypothetical protein ACJ76V_14605 [Thermoleophilaceae bacterium]